MRPYFYYLEENLIRLDFLQYQSYSLVGGLGRVMQEEFQYRFSIRKTVDVC